MKDEPGPGGPPHQLVTGAQAVLIGGLVFAIGGGVLLILGTTLSGEGGPAFLLALGLIGFAVGGFVLHRRIRDGDDTARMAGIAYLIVLVLLGGAGAFWAGATLVLSAIGVAGLINLFSRAASDYCADG